MIFNLNQNISYRQKKLKILFENKKKIKLKKIFLIFREKLKILSGNQRKSNFRACPILKQEQKFIIFVVKNTNFIESLIINGINFIHVNLLIVD